eukprot:39170-Chlamydomonas_euryale.AAC.10
MPGVEVANRGEIRFVKKGARSVGIELTISYEVPDVLVPFANALTPVVEGIIGKVRGGSGRRQMGVARGTELSQARGDSRPGEWGGGGVELSQARGDSGPGGWGGGGVELRQAHVCSVSRESAREGARTE